MYTEIQSGVWEFYVQGIYGIDSGACIRRGRGRNMAKNLVKKRAQEPSYVIYI